MPVPGSIPRAHLVRRNMRRSDRAHVRYRAHVPGFPRQIARQPARPYHRFFSLYFSRAYSVVGCVVVTNRTTRYTGGTSNSSRKICRALLNKYYVRASIRRAVSTPYRCRFCFRRFSKNEKRTIIIASHPEILSAYIPTPFSRPDFIILSHPSHPPRYEVALPWCSYNEERYRIITKW